MDWACSVFSCLSLSPLQLLRHRNKVNSLAWGIDQCSVKWWGRVEKGQELGSLWLKRWGMEAGKAAPAWMKIWSSHPELPCMSCCWLQRSPGLLSAPFITITTSSSHQSLQFLFLFVGWEKCMCVCISEKSLDNKIWLCSLCWGALTELCLLFQRSSIWVLPLAGQESEFVSSGGLRIFPGRMSNICRTWREVFIFCYQHISAAPCWMESIARIKGVAHPLPIYSQPCLYLIRQSFRDRIISLITYNNHIGSYWISVKCVYTLAYRVLSCDIVLHLFRFLLLLVCLVVKANQLLCLNPAYLHGV